MKKRSASFQLAGNGILPVPFFASVSKKRPPVERRISLG
jgi:hypothetical protein